MSKTATRPAPTSEIGTSTAIFGADTVPLASATTTMPDCDELARFRDRISELLGGTFDAEPVRHRLVADIIENAKRVASGYESALDADHTRSVLGEVAAERERLLDKWGSGSEDTYSTGDWESLHSVLSGELHSLHPNESGYRPQLNRAMAAYRAHIESIDSAESTAQGETV